MRWYFIVARRNVRGNAPIVFPNPAGKIDTILARKQT
jgi:hypothetical protein